MAVQPRLFRGTEDLFEMAVLPLIDDIENEIGILVCDAIDDGRQIGRAVKHRAVRFEQDERRHFLLVGRLGDRNDQRAFAHHRKPARLQVFDHRRDQRDRPSASPFHRSKCTPRLPYSRVRPTSETPKKCRHNAR